MKVPELTVRGNQVRLRLCIATAPWSSTEFSGRLVRVGGLWPIAATKRTGLLRHKTMRSAQLRTFLWLLALQCWVDPLLAGSLLLLLLLLLRLLRRGRLLLCSGSDRYRWAEIGHGCLGWACRRVPVASPRDRPFVSQRSGAGRRSLSCQ